MFPLFSREGKESRACHGPQVRASAGRTGQGRSENRHGPGRAEIFEDVMGRAWPGRTESFEHLVGQAGPGRDF